MGRLSVWIACLGVAVALTAPASKAIAGADISINLRVGDPYRGPRLVFEREPDIVVVPGTRVYYVRDYDYDIYRYGSYWYYNYDGNWYRARRYSGPFVFIGYNAVPRSVAYVPVRYRRHWREAPRGHAYGHYKNRDDRWHRDNRVRERVETRERVRVDDRGRDDDKHGHKDSWKDKGRGH
jgi:hypothetical protein